MKKKTEEMCNVRWPDLVECEKDYDGLCPQQWVRLEKNKAIQHRHHHNELCTGGVRERSMRCPCFLCRSVFSCHPVTLFLHDS